MLSFNVGKVTYNVHGWSVHTEKFTKFNKGDQLSMEEQDHIMNVISKAEYLDQVEQERIG